MKRSRIVRIIGVTLGTAALALASPGAAEASSGYQNCGPTLRVQTKSTGSAQHTHVFNGVVYSTNTGPNFRNVYKKWSGHSGSWSTNHNGSANCW